MDMLREDQVQNVTGSQYRHSGTCDLLTGEKEDA